jgi:hypothetical protein
MRDHKKEWTKRRKFYDKLKDSIIDISSGIDAIIHEQSPSEENENIQQPEVIENIANGEATEKAIPSEQLKESLYNYNFIQKNCGDQIGDDSSSNEFCSEQCGVEHQLEHK